MNKPQDFSHKNLRGRSFKNQDLSGANFIYADIRGADFTGANLTGANFSNAKAGLQLHQAIFLLVISLILSVLSGIFALLPSFLLAFSLHYEKFKILSIISGSLLVILTLVIFAIFRSSISQNIAQGTQPLWVRDLNILWVSALLGFGGVGLVPILGAVVISVGLSKLVGVVASVIAMIVTGVGVLAFWIIADAQIKVMVGDAFFSPKHLLISILILLMILSVISTLGGAGFGIYLSWVAFAGDEAHKDIYNFAIMFAIVGGTSFRGANLTHTNFTYATLKNTDFLGANLINTCWKEAKKLDRSRVTNSILAKKAVRDLLVSGNGYKKSYIGANLQGANLEGANLKEANLQKVNINQANLQRANLEGANLTKAQAIGTNFTNAYLTGACLEAWNIHNTTTLENVDIRFFYILEEPNSENETLEHCPSNGDFAKGEFIKLFALVLNSVDLIFQSRVNWPAFRVAFKEVKVANQDVKLFIQSIENSIDGAIVINVGVPENAKRMSEKGSVKKKKKD